MRSPTMIPVPITVDAWLDVEVWGDTAESRRAYIRLASGQEIPIPLEAVAAKEREGSEQAAWGDAGTPEPVADPQRAELGAHLKDLGLAMGRAVR